MKLFYTDHFLLPLPEGHRFPLEKYRRLREFVEQNAAGRFHLLEAPAATDDQLLLAHDADYVRRAVAGELTRDEQRRIGFPWSAEMVERSRRSTGATIAAARAALAEKTAANLAGGTHHAGPNWGEGYCVFNDVAVAVRVLLVEGTINTAVILDCDVHQGNGTAAIFSGDERAFTFSIHGQKNFPSRKVPGDLDVGLPDGCEDAEYLAALDGVLNQIFAGNSQRFDMAFCIAGADPYVGDRLGRLKLTKAGLRERDERVFSACRAAKLPVVVTMGGGYATNLDDIAEIHFGTIETAWRILAI